MSRVALPVNDVASRPGPSGVLAPKMKFFVFDCETSGLLAHRDRIVEFAVIEYVSGRSVAEMEPHSVLINPGRKLTKENIKIHGISNAMLKDAPPFSEAWDFFLAYVEDACEDGECPVLVAHNAEFDVNFLRSELRRARESFPDWYISCSLKLARQMWPGQPAKLSDLTAKFNVDEYAEHRAGGDVQGLCKVLDSINDIVTRTGETVQDLLLKNAKKFEVYGDRQGSVSRLQTKSSSSPASSMQMSDRVSPLPSSSRVVPHSRAQRAASSEARGRNVKDESKVTLRTSEAGNLTTPPRQTGRAQQAQTSSGRDAATICQSSMRSPSLTTTSVSGRVFVAPTGACYHVDEHCYGLRKARSTSVYNRNEMPSGRRPCKVCCKGPGHDWTLASRDSSSTYSGSPRSVFSTASDASSDAVEANYYRALTGVRYHLRRDCYGLRSAKAKIPCATIPPGLTPCKVCAGG